MDINTNNKISYILVRISYKIDSVKIHLEREEGENAMDLLKSIKEDLEEINSTLSNLETEG